jgi:hypothetical protein
MEIIIYKTTEIPSKIWDQIVKGFNASFNNHPTTKKRLIGDATSNSFGYSYHAVCIENDLVIGYNTIIPNYYVRNGKEKIIIGLSGSTFVLKEYRKDIFIFHDMYMELKKYCAKENIIAFLGVPNLNSYQYSIKFLHCIEVFCLNYYILPVKISNILKARKFSFLNILSELFSLFLIAGNRLLTHIFNPTENKANYRIEINDAFLEKRFKDKRYKSISKGNIKFTYVISNENGIKCAYIMYFGENGIKTLKSLTLAVSHIFQLEKIDIIMFVGTLRINQSILIKVPTKFQPRKLPFTYNLLDSNDSEKYSDMDNKNNWDFSLLNLDVR